MPPEVPVLVLLPGSVVEVEADEGLPVPQDRLCDFQSAFLAFTGAVERRRALGAVLERDVRGRTLTARAGPGGGGHHEVLDGTGKG
jgi:hypothetical protein